MSGRALTLARIASVLRESDLLREVRGPEDTVVSGASHDSRRVEPGDLFLAWRGTIVDGHDFLLQAQAAGAHAALVERAVPSLAIPQVVVSNGRRAAALAAHALEGFPGRALRLAGVTGTNGKSTTALLGRHLLSGLPAGCAALGTLGVVGPDGQVREGTEGLTTPDPVTLARTLRELVDEGVGTVIMEASSHALAQYRLDALPFKAAAFTNLSQDHLDYHGTLEAYREAKVRLAGLVAEGGTLVVNADDPAWADLRGEGCLTFSVTGGADLVARDVAASAHGSTFTLCHGDAAVPVRLPLVGAFNVENALAAAGVALALGRSLDEVAAGLSTAPQIPGRMETVVEEPFVVLIDFAHTPDALENLLATLRPLCRGRLLVVFGAGGDRDRQKRSPMGASVARWADAAYLTSDNPRTEDPERILDDVAPGLGSLPFVRLADRRAAIHRAVADATDGDVVVLAGKGHETHQVVGTERRPFDERVVVAQAMAARGAA